MKIYCVCAHCGHHSSDEASLEINFRDEMIYFVCEKCKKESKLVMKAPSKALPRIRTRL